MKNSIVNLNQNEIINVAGGGYKELLEEALEEAAKSIAAVVIFIGGTIVTFYLMIRCGLINGRDNPRGT